MDGFFEVIFTEYPIVGWLLLGGFLVYRGGALLVNKLKADSTQDNALEQLRMEDGVIKNEIQSIKDEVDAIYKELEHFEDNLIELEKRRYADMELINQSLKDMVERMDSNYERVSEKVDNLNSTLVQLFTELNFNKK